MEKKKKPAVIPEQPIEHTFRSVYKLPFTRMYSYAWTANNNMAFMKVLGSKEDPMDKAIAILNGTDGQRITNRLEWIDSDATIYAYDDSGNKSPFLIVRGWGHLTGTGGLNLPYDKAAQIQDDFGNWIVETLTTKQNEP